MELVTGGAFQGKLDYAIKEYGFTDADVCECAEDAEPDFAAPCICHYERYVMRCLREGKAPRTDFAEVSDAPETADGANPASPKVIIMDDIFCGVVPADPELRAWRELCGRTLTALSQKADKVTRLFCGIPKTLK
ncbi:MAG: bifunctional adenosylcobinamide kinase/adenosylcobinamide-phosphate guanylyltransferase [Firmicutes bacterium]|nr:bifunctional adenosylcobinamide kinase/adenosylcobinamide-phosphate guanylyltransferase [Bacillota bacterium]